MGYTPLRRCSSSSLTSRKTQIKTYMKVYSNLVRTAGHQENKGQQVLARMWGNRNPTCCCWKCKQVKPIWKSLGRFLKKTKGKPHDPALRLLDIYLKFLKLAYPRDMFTSVFIDALFTITTTRNQPRCPSANEQIKKCSAHAQ